MLPMEFVKLIPAAERRVRALALLDLFVKLNAGGRTVIVVTHERDISRYTDRQVSLVDGQFAADYGSR